MVLCYWLLSFWLLSMHFGLLLEKCQKKVLVGLCLFRSNMQAKLVSSTHWLELLLFLAFLLVQSSSLVLTPIIMSSMQMHFFNRCQESLTYRWEAEK